MDVYSSRLGSNTGSEHVKLLALDLGTMLLADLFNARVHKVIALNGLLRDWVQRLTNANVEVLR